MTEITDEYMKMMMPKTKECCLVILKSGPNKAMKGVEKIIWEHGRRNFSLRADGLLTIVVLSGMGARYKELGFSMPAGTKSFNHGRRSWREGGGFCVQSPYVLEFPGGLPPVILPDLERQVYLRNMERSNIGTIGSNYSQKRGVDYHGNAMTSAHAIFSVSICPGICIDGNSDEDLWFSGNTQRGFSETTPEPD